MDSTQAREEVSIKVKRQLYEMLVPMAEAAGFASVDEYVTFVLEEVAQTEQTGMDSQQQDKVMERLRNLGYM